MWPLAWPPPPPSPSTSIPSAPSTTGRGSVERGARRARGRPRARHGAARHLDHADFRARVGPLVKSATAENVAWGCATADCVFRVWAKSGGHRDNMLCGAVGLRARLGDGENGRRYWALELGNSLLPSPR